MNGFNKKLTLKLKQKQVHENKDIELHLKKLKNQLAKDSNQLKLYEDVWKLEKHLSLKERDQLIQRYPLVGVLRGLYS